MDDVEPEFQLMWDRFSRDGGFEIVEPICSILGPFLIWLKQCIFLLLTPIRQFYRWSIGLWACPVVTRDHETLARVSQSSGWMQAAYRGIDLHPECPWEIMALLTREDTVLLFDDRFGAPTELADREQRDVTCIAFRPWSQDYALAVGCAAGICLWSGNRVVEYDQRICYEFQMKMLQDEGHTKVTSLQWNEDGTILASAALGCSHIVVWEPETRDKLRLVAVPGSVSPNTFLKYGDNFQKLLCVSYDIGAAIFDLRESVWQPHQILPNIKVQSAAWTHSSAFLLFVRRADCHLYALTHNVEPEVFLRPDTFWTVERLMDLRQIRLGSLVTRACGDPQSIVMDPMGFFLAIIFKERPYVLLARVDEMRGSSPKIKPLEYIEQQDNENMACVNYPSCLAFTKARSEDPSTRWLVICWSSSHIQRKVLPPNPSKPTPKDPASKAPTSKAPTSKAPTSKAPTSKAPTSTPKPKSNENPFIDVFCPEPKRVFNYYK